MLSIPSDIDYLINEAEGIFDIPVKKFLPNEQTLEWLENLGFNQNQLNQSIVEKVIETISKKLNHPITDNSYYNYDNFSLNLIFEGFEDGEIEWYEAILLLKGVDIENIDFSYRYNEIDEQRIERIKAEINASC